MSVSNTLRMLLRNRTYSKETLYVRYVSNLHFVTKVSMYKVYRHVIIVLEAKFMENVWRKLQ
jgi:hypothetical protein